MKKLIDYIFDNSNIKHLNNFLNEADDDLDNLMGDDNSNEESKDDKSDKPALGTEEADKKKKEDDKNPLKRGEIVFTIWETPTKKVNWLKDNESYQKIEYKCEFKEEHLEIDFLLGYRNGSWRLWIGKIGACSYDDDPYCDFKTKKFAEAIVKCLDKVEEFIKDVKEDPTNYVQFYKNL